MMEDVRFEDDKVLVDIYHHAAMQIIAIKAYERGECSRMRLASFLQCSLFHLDEAIEHLKGHYPEMQKREIERAKERVAEAKMN